MNTGLLYASLAFVLWGLFPLYFHLLAAVPAFEVVLHRSLWSLVFVACVLGYLRRWHWLQVFRAQPKQLLLYACSALLLAANWLVYVHAVQTQQVIEASLGYFINPLFNVALGVLVLRERLGVVKWVAVGLAAIGVVWMTWHLGRLPWIALVLAVCFSVYGLIRKTSALGALEGLALETLMLAPLVLPLLGWWTLAHGGVLLSADPLLIALVLLTGPLSVLPLLLFAAGARRLQLATLGLVQYVAPSIQLMLGLWVFNEPFDGPRLVGFAFIWTALALVSIDALRQLIKPWFSSPG